MRVAYFLLAAVLLAACGQNGPLYLPSEGQTQATAPALQPTPGGK